MGDSVQLGLFGAFHVDDLGKVTDELDTFLADEEAIFYEYPAEPLTVYEVLQLVLRAPVFFIGLLSIRLVFFWPLYVLLNRELEATEIIAVRRIGEQRNRPTHAVDEHPTKQLSRAGPGMIALNWAVLVPLAYLYPWWLPTSVAVLLVSGLVPKFVHEAGYPRLAVGLAIVAMAGMAVAVYKAYLSAWLLVIGVVAFYAVVYWSVDSRNERMLERVRSLSDEHGYDSAVLVTGQSHLPGMASLTPDFDLELSKVHQSTWRDAGEIDSGADYRAELELDAEDDGEGERTASQPIVPREDPDAYRQMVDGSETGVRWQRLGAGLVDGLCVTFLSPLGAIVAVFGYLGLIALQVWTGVGPVGPDSPTNWQAVAVGGWYATAVGYHGHFEFKYGTTPGKRLFGLAVGTEDATEILTWQALVRNLLRPLDMLLVGPALILGAERAQRLGDRVSNTLVGEMKSTEDRPQPAIAAGGSWSLQARRGGAVLLDAAAAGFLGTMLYTWVILFLHPVTGVLAYVNPTAGLVFSAVVAGVGYHTVAEWWYGRTFGKVIAGLTVADDAGGRLRGRQALLRNLVRPVDAATLYLLSGASLLSTDDRRSLPDRVAGTIVRRREQPRTPVEAAQRPTPPEQGKPGAEPTTTPAQQSEQ